MSVNIVLINVGKGGFVPEIDFHSSHLRDMFADTSQQETTRPFILTFNA